MTVQERAASILVNASKDESGQILTTRTLGGWCIQAGTWKVEQLKGREETAWQEALELLTSLGYIYLFNEDGVKWSIYKLTTEGWSKAGETTNEFQVNFIFTNTRPGGTKSFPLAVVNRSRETFDDYKGRLLDEINRVLMVTGFDMPPENVKRYCCHVLFKEDGPPYQILYVGWVTEFLRTFPVLRVCEVQDFPESEIRFINLGTNPQQ